MTKCTLCTEEAVVKDKNPLNRKDGSKVFLCYCKLCATAGILFGFLEKEELERIK